MIPKFEKGYCPDLLSWKELSNLINIRPLMSASRVRVFGEGTDTWKNNYWCTDANCYPSGILEQVIEESGVCYFTDMSRATEKINEFAKNLEDEYDQEVDAHIYLCRNLEPRHPFEIHFDISDNVIVQCEGTTNFKVWDAVSNPEELLKEEKDVKIETDKQTILDVDMQPGDAIWIPRYYPHLATSKNARMSISFPVAENVPRQPREWIEL